MQPTLNCNRPTLSSPWFSQTNASLLPFTMSFKILILHPLYITIPSQLWWIEYYFLIINDDREFKLTNLEYRKLRRVPLCDSLCAQIDNIDRDIGALGCYDRAGRPAHVTRPDAANVGYHILPFFLISHEINWKLKTEVNIMKLTNKADWWNLDHNDTFKNQSVIDCSLKINH